MACLHWVKVVLYQILSTITVYGMINPQVLLIAYDDLQTSHMMSSWLELLQSISVFPLTHNRCEVVISWWSQLLPKISIYATKCESILEKSGIFIHLQSKYCINLSCKKNLTISWLQIAARW